MNNELQILPLRLYEVTYSRWDNGNNFSAQDRFTADFHDVFEGRTRFYRTGNIIREYHVMLEKIIVTPVDEE